MAIIGIIGGSGLDNPDIFSDQGSTDQGSTDQGSTDQGSTDQGSTDQGSTDQGSDVTTPFGPPSSPLKQGTIGGVKVLLLARHGREHTIPPTQVNYRANIRALKDAGCTHIVATTAVGSLREEIRRGDLVFIDQFIDFTKQRKMSFHESFAPHSPVHTAMADPYDPGLRQILIAEARRLGYPFHDRGTVVTIEGPRFSTRAESHMFRAWGADIINMSIATETVLANEIGIPYAAVAMSTDYDSWRSDEEPVTWEAISRVFAENAARVTTLLMNSVSKI